MIQRLSNQTGTVKDEPNGYDIIINQGKLCVYIYIYIYVYIYMYIYIYVYSYCLQ